MRWLLSLILLLPAAQAAIDPFTFDDPAQQQRYRALIEELRCPKCQNTNIAGSDAPLAADLRQKVYDLIRTGDSNAEIKAYMVQRYGDFVMYRPPVKPLTWPLWFGPGVVLMLVGIGLAIWIRRRARQTPTPLSEQEQARLRELLARDREEPR